MHPDQWWEVNYPRTVCVFHQLGHTWMTWPLQQQDNHAPDACYRNSRTTSSRHELRLNPALSLLLKATLQMNGSTSVMSQSQQFWRSPSRALGGGITQTSEIPSNLNSFNRILLMARSKLTTLLYQGNWSSGVFSLGCYPDSCGQQPCMTSGYPMPMAWRG